jgi:enoyl-CoA hydratase
VYCVLTGERLKSADAVAAGIATHRVPSARFAELAEALCADISVDAVIGAFAEPAGKGPLLPLQPAIDGLFGHDNVEEILSALDCAAAGKESHAGFASATASSIRTKCPISLKIALAQMRASPGMDFEECMRTEFRIVSRVVREPNFYEGIRAAIIDKSQAPRWQPDSLSAVSAEEVARYFEPVALELSLP